MLLRRDFLVTLLFFLPGWLAEAARKKSTKRLGPRLKTYEALIRQNKLADSYGLLRIRDQDSELNIDQFIAKGWLVPVPRSTLNFYVDLDVDKRFKGWETRLQHARPWVVEFLNFFGGEYRVEFGFGEKLKVSSLTRTEAQQAFLEKKGISDAECKVLEHCTPHLTGAAVDLSKKGMNRKQRNWVLQELRLWMKKGVLDFIDERSNFHIFVPPDWLLKYYSTN